MLSRLSQPGAAPGLTSKPASIYSPTCGETGFPGQEDKEKRTSPSHVDLYFPAKHLFLVLSKHKGPLLL